MFLHGFSAGSQFVHRFAMNHSKRVCGVSAHSGGTWATDDYGKISAEWKNLDGLAKKPPPAKPASPDLATIPEETLRAAFAKADAEEIPADTLTPQLRGSNAKEGNYRWSRPRNSEDWTHDQKALPHFRSLHPYGIGWGG